MDSKNNVRFTLIAVLLAVIIGVFIYKVEPLFTKEKEQMKKVVIYSTQTCPYCVRAKKLLDDKKVAYTEYRVDLDSEKREEMIRLSGGRRTVPQIFIDDKHIGGSDDLYELEKKGELDKLLGKQVEK